MRDKPHLLQGEKILLTSQSSIWFFVVILLRSIVVIVLPTILIFSFLAYFFWRDWMIFSIISFSIFILGFICWYKHSLWKDPVFLATNKRIIFENEKNLISSQLVELTFNNVSGISLKKKTLIQSILNFGTITIIPVSGSGAFTIKYVPNARNVVNKIMEAYTQKAEHNNQEPAYRNLESFLKQEKGVLDFFQLTKHEAEVLSGIESKNNRGVLAVLKKEKVFCILRDQKINFPSDAICSLPSLKVYHLIMKRFKKEGNGDDDVLFVGIDE